MCFNLSPIDSPCKMCAQFLKEATVDYILLTVYLFHIFVIKSNGTFTYKVLHNMKLLHDISYCL